MTSSRLWHGLCLCMTLLVGSLVAPGLALAAETAVPKLERRVTDQTGTLDAASIVRLEADIQALETEKGAQIAVLMVPTTDGEPIEQYAVRVFEAWKLGRQKTDDGVLFVIAKNDRTLRIEVGYGLEGAVTDAQASRIIREQVTPRFREGDFTGGVEAGVNALIGLVKGEALPPVEKAKANAAETVRGIPTGILFGAGLVLVILPVWAAALLGAVAGFLFTGSLLFVLLGGVLGVICSVVGKGFLPGGAARTMSRRGLGRGGLGGGFGGGFGGGGGGFGGGGGGGFSGGGGRSGGGGASGSW